MKSVIVFLVITCFSGISNSAQEGINADVKVYLSFLESSKVSLDWLQKAFESGDTTKNKDNVCYQHKFELATAYSYIAHPEARDMVRKVSSNGIITYHIMIATEYINGRRDPKKVLDIAYIFEQGKAIGFRVDHLPKGWWAIAYPSNPDIITFSKPEENCVPYMASITNPFFLFMPIVVDKF